jgi:hypothetical protein
MSASPRLGSHLVSPRTGYTHHGIYAGDGKVIHYAGFGDGPHSGPVELTTLARFKGGGGFHVKKHGNAAFNGKDVVERAHSRIGENVYCLFSNNCEHFANWCIDGDHASTQVDFGAAASAPTAGTLIGLGARAGVSASGPVAGLSGAGSMGGLAEIGAVVGGGTVAGIAIVGGAGGAAMASLINGTLLKDNSAHDRKERSSRSVGRKASYAGAAAGTAGSVAAISAMGTTAGLSAAGITSGLAAIGGTVGGGMAAGIAVTAAAPAAAAAVLGYGLYKAAKWLAN